ncbi:phospholipase A2 [Echria macrotheca]|uniref:Phospholipase A2 n=1 Tax=Echria macrotheca TaxID=438768 RepID=A0AAJ0F4P9_9PEZI|nr:phospholipase A2 [Echria macrotheca]
MGETDEKDPIANLINTYNELNTPHIVELDEEPSPLEFMRFVARNTPFVVRKGAAGWKATQTWSAAFLEDLLAGETVNVAVTPAGNADAPTPDASGTLVFAKPWEEDQPFSDFLRFVIAQEQNPSSPTNNYQEVRYAQTQNDNLRNEYISLFTHVPPDIPFARIALAQPGGPDAINLWIGNSRSVTALHRDNYENIYVQVLGSKHFVLLPPLCQPCVNEQLLRPAVYQRISSPSSSGLELLLEDDAENAADKKVPFAIWDPDRPAENATAYSHLAQPMRVTLEPGDMLYLPCMWYHKVSQSCSDEGICVAVNYWYDMDFSGPLYPLCNFVKSVNNNTNNTKTT